MTTPCPWWRCRSFHTKVLILSLLAGGVGWTGMAFLQERNTREVLQQQYLHTLEEHAMTERTRLDAYLADQLSFLKQMTLQTGFHAYLVQPVAAKREDAGEYPAWLPPKELIAARLRTDPFVLLLDDQARIREFYRESGGSLPAGLQERLSLYAQNSQNEAILELAGRPYFLASVAVEDVAAPRTGLALLVPMDDQLLMGLHGEQIADDIIALVNDAAGDTMVLASSQPDAVAEGTPLSRYQNEFILMGRKILDAGYTSEMLPQTVIMFRKDAVEHYVAELLQANRYSGGIVVLVQILALIPLLLWLNRRLGLITAMIHDFSRQQRIPLPERVVRADELDTLRFLFQHVIDQIDAAQKAIQTELERRIRAEEASRHNEQRLATLVEHLPLLLIEVDRRGHVTRWNHAAQAILELDAADSLGKGLASLPLSWDRDALARGIRQTLQDHTENLLERIPLTGQISGAAKVLELHIFPAAQDDARFLILGADISERMRIEANLANSRKMEAVGTLAAGIAHEINTPIQFVGDNVHFLQEAFQDLNRLLARYQDWRDQMTRQGGCEEAVAELAALEQSIDLTFLVGEVPKAMSEIREGVERVSAIVRAMKDFAHIDSGEKEETDVNAALADTLLIARNEIKLVANVETDFDPGLPLVRCFRNEMKQVYLNLLVNAAHAIRDKPDRTAGERGVIRVATRREGNDLLIRIDDTGCGIPPHLRERIFEPFFTTKPVGQGSGQGLAIAHAVVTQKHGGSLTVSSEEGAGAAFSIRLPLDAP